MAERFWEKVERREPDECWPWTASVDHRGYGKFGLSPAQQLEFGLVTVQAHRMAFFLTYGRWPDPCALHGCDNPPCCNAVNPEHIHEGTLEQNTQEMIARGRIIPPRKALSPEQEALVRAKFAAGGENLGTLSREFGVGRATIGRTLYGPRYGSAWRNARERAAGI